VGGRELVQHFAVPQVGSTELRAAAIHVADYVAAQHPHELDDTSPRFAGRLLAQDPAIAAGVLELLDALGFLPAGYAQLRARKAELEAQIATATSINQQLKEGQ
jgi:hypothetical protein